MAKRTKKYWVNCSVVNYQSVSIEVEAKNKAEAQEIGESEIGLGLGEVNDSNIEIHETLVTEG